jgi:hypothetical protein
MPIAFATFQVTINHMHSQKIIKNECQFLRVKKQESYYCIFLRSTVNSSCTYKLSTNDKKWSQQVCV